MNLHNQLSSLNGDLHRLDGATPASVPMMRAFNTLLDMAKEDHGDNRIVGAIETLDLRETVDVGTLRVLVGQIQAAIKPRRGPGVA